MESNTRPSSGSPAFEIWQAGSKVLSVDNPVRLRILRQLEHGPRTLTELVAATKKAKSTLSALHMPPLVKAGLVGQSLDPNDSRVKWFKLLGSRLGSSAVDTASLREAVLAYAQKQGLLPLKTLLRVIDPGSLFNRNQREYADGVAERLGHIIGGMLAKDKSAREKQLAGILEAEGLGRLSWSHGRMSVEPINPWASRFVLRVAEVALAERAAA